MTGVDELDFKLVFQQCCDQSWEEFGVGIQEIIGCSSWEPINDLGDDQEMCSIDISIGQWTSGNLNFSALVSKS